MTDFTAYVNGFGQWHVATRRACAAMVAGGLTYQRATQFANELNASLEGVEPALTVLIAHAFAKCVILANGGQWGALYLGGASPAFAAFHDREIK